MTKQRYNKKGFTLVELIMAIALLAFFGTMIVQVFFKAHQLTRQAAVLDQAVALAADLSDIWKTDPQALTPGRTDQTYYDKSFQACPKDEAVYRADLAALADPAGIWLLRIKISQANEPGQPSIYELEAGQWPGGE